MLQLITPNTLDNSKINFTPLSLHASCRFPQGLSKAVMGNIMGSNRKITLAFTCKICEDRSAYQVGCIPLPPVCNVEYPVDVGWCALQIGLSTLARLLVNVFSCPNLLTESKTGSKHDISQEFSVSRYFALLKAPRIRTSDRSVAQRVCGGTKLRKYEEPSETIRIPGLITLGREN